MPQPTLFKPLPAKNQNRLQPKKVARAMNRNWNNALNGTFMVKKTSVRKSNLNRSDQSHQGSSLPKKLHAVVTSG